MIGVLNRVPGAKCEVGTCFVDAAYTEEVTVIPGDPSLRHERHRMDVALCQCHGDQFRRGGLIGTLTAYGDRIAERAL